MIRRANAVFRRSGRIAPAVAVVFLLAAAGVAVARSGPATVTSAKGKLGTMVAARNGHTLYMFTLDKSGKSSCYGTCTKTWAPDYTRGKPVAAPGSGIKASLLGTIKRQSGAYQATYNGHPLYFYSGDKQTGDMHGEARNTFGGRWYALGTNGKALKPINPQNSGGFNPGQQGY